MKPIEIPERFTGTVYFYIRTDPEAYWSYGKLRADDHDFGDDNPDYMKVGQIDVDVPLESAGAVDKQVSALKAARDQCLKETAAKMNWYDEQIQSLLAIEHQESSDETA